MSCIQPPALGDDQLLLYLDGEGDQNIQDHITACAYCRGQAESLERFHAQVRAGLYRGRCPSTLELGEYQLHLIAEDRSFEIKNHLQGCPDCVQELDQLAGYLAALTPERSTPAINRVKTLLARMVNDLDWGTGAEALKPVFTGLRGPGDGPKRYEVDNYEITIEVQPDTEAPAKRTLYGLVLGDLKSGFTATLYDESGKISSAPLDLIGNFVLPGVNTGTYDLLLQGDEMEIHIPGLVV
jgi:hypothetical protein